MRKALSHAFDYEAAGRRLRTGHDHGGPLATGLEPWHKKDHRCFATTWRRPRPRWRRVPTLMASRWTTSTSPVTREELFGLILLEKAGELGITVNMVPMLWPDMVATAVKADTAPASMAVYSGDDYLDRTTSSGRRTTRHRPGSGRPRRTMNPEFDKLLEDARADTNQENRKALYDEAQLMLVNDAVEIWVYTQIANEAWVPELADHTPIMGGDLRTFGPTGSSRCLNFGARRRRSLAAAGAASGTRESRQLHPAPRLAPCPDVVRGLAADVRAVADRAR